MLRNVAPIALGALLLFLIQPLMAKAILPTHGGAAGVWTACLVFYQCGLLAGYLYAYLLSRAPFRWQALLHGLMLAASIAFLPIGAPPSDEMSRRYPEYQILLGLLRTIGLPYLLLASTSPLIQSWRGERTQDPRVFRWFAISNFGSLLGLLAYPFAIEPFTHLAQQQMGWTVAYLVYAALVVVAMVWNARPHLPSPERSLVAADETTPSAPPALFAPWSAARAALCVALAACSTILLGASTNQMSQSGVVVPFLWVLPLTLYLASFVICFQWTNLARPSPWIRIYFAAGFLACGLLFWGALLSIPWQITGYALVVLAGSMACHAQLHALRPDPKRLTLYYLLIALGGALGGAMTGLVAPQLFSDYWEFHLGIGLTAVLLAACEGVRLAPRLRRERFARNTLAPLTILAPLFLLTLLGVHVDALRSDLVIARQRDFFGVVSVIEDPRAERRLMLHGKTQHGAQSHRSGAASDETIYFTSESGVAKAIAWRRASQARPLRLGVIGLGTGSFLTHAQPGDRVDFYEISPAVDALARRHFSYLADHQGEVSVAIGDGRALLARELRTRGPRAFDLLVIDAFSGDALPMHLLTLEALQLYEAHLAPGGLLAFQITNRYLDLAPILAAAAQARGRRAAIVEQAPPEEGGFLHSRVRWAILFPPETREAELPEWARGPLPTRRVAPWTDDFGSLWSALR